MFAAGNAECFFALYCLSKKRENAQNIENGKIWHKYHRKMEKYGVFELLRVF